MNRIKSISFRKDLWQIRKKSIDKNHDKKSVPAFEERWDKAVRFDRTETAELANEKLSEEYRNTDDEDHQEIRNL